MATEPYSIVVGPGSIWVAPVGTAFPAVDATPAVDWVSLGNTDGGVRITHVRETAEHGVDQSVLPQKRTLTRAAEEIRFSLAGLTLETYTKALDGATVTPTAAGAGTAGDKAFNIEPGVVEYAMLIRVPSPYMAGYLQYEYARVARMDNSEVPYTKDGKTLIPTAWSALEDLDNPGQFGTIRAQHEAAL
jgi:hypothetical protein